MVYMTESEIYPQSQKKPYFPQHLLEIMKHKGVERIATNTHMSIL